MSREPAGRVRTEGTYASQVGDGGVTLQTPSEGMRFGETHSRSQHGDAPAGSGAAVTSWELMTSLLCSRWCRQHVPDSYFVFICCGTMNVTV